MRAILDFITAAGLGNRIDARHARGFLTGQIGPQERDEWLLCMRLALDETVADEALRTALYAQFAQLGEHMRNRGDGVQSCGHGSHAQHAA